jgi:hypothetical protein
MRRRLLAVALLFATAAPAAAGVIAGYDPAVHDRFTSGFPTEPVPNSSSLFLGSGVDLSGIGWRADAPQFAVTLISPQHVIGAAHVGFGSGQVQFVNAAGQVMTYTVTGTTRISTAGTGLNSDLLLGTLSAPVPEADGIRYFGVADVTTATAVGLPMLAYGQNPAYSTSPHLGTNVIDTVGLASFDDFQTEATWVMVFDWTPDTPGEIYLIPGDSGGPAFVRAADGDFALIGVHYGVSRVTTDPQPGDFSASTFLPEYIDGLNAAMAGTGFQVTLVPVPEPAGLLAAAGLVAVAAWGRRFRIT